MVLALVWRQVHIRIDRMATRCGPRIFCVEEDCAAWIFHMIGARLCGKKENHFGNDLIDRTIGIGELSKGWSKSWLRPLTVAIWVHVFSARKKHLLTLLLQYPKIYFCFGQFSIFLYDFHKQNPTLFESEDSHNGKFGEFLQQDW